MRPASDSILSAVEGTYVVEDRLTEVLASVAHVNQGFAAELVRMAGGRTGARKRYVVGTQRATSSGRRVDMEIATYEDFDRAGLVWIEVKAGAAYQHNQLQDYAREVKDPVHGHPNGKVLTIIPPNAPKEVDTAPGPPRWECKTWSEVALAADRLGRKDAVGQRRWRREAMQPEAPAQWRYLAELIRRLEEKGYAKMEPLTPEDVIAAQRIVTFPQTIHDLFRSVRGSIQGVTRVKSSGLKGGRFQTFAPSEPKWFSDPDQFGNAYPELLYWHEEHWTPDQRGAPAFWAGITFYDISDSTRHRLRDKDWQNSLPAGVDVGGGGWLLRVGRTKYLSELVVAGATLDEQAEALGAWASQAITDVMDADQVTAPTRRLKGPEDEVPR